MHYSYQECQEIVQALRVARRYLSSSSYECFDTGSSKKKIFICNALKKAFEYGDIELSAVRLTTRLILNRIHPYNNLSMWLTKTHPSLHREVDQDERFESGVRIQKYRRAWMNALIAEFTKRAEKCKVT